MVPRDGVKKEKQHVLFTLSCACAYLRWDGLTIPPRQAGCGQEEASSSHLHLCCFSLGYGSDRYPVEAGRGSGCGERGV